MNDHTSLLLPNYYYKDKATINMFRVLEDPPRICPSPQHLITLPITIKVLGMKCFVLIEVG